MSARAPIAAITSSNASLTVAVFDASGATEWSHTKPAATKAQFTGHPAEIMRGLGRGEDAVAIDVGAAGGFAFELEGKSGQLEAYRRDDGALALIAPPHAWWREHHGGHGLEVDALFEAVLDGVDDASEIGELELTSGKLAVVYLWFKKVGAARELATTLPAGGALAFTDGYSAGNGALVVDLGAGPYQLLRREVTAPWDDRQSLIAMCFVRA